MKSTKRRGGESGGRPAAPPGDVEGRGGQVVEAGQQPLALFHGVI